MKKSIVYGLVSFFSIFISMVIGGELLKVLHLRDDWASFVLLAGGSGFIAMLVTKRLLR